MFVSTTVLSLTSCLDIQGRGTKIFLYLRTHMTLSQKHGHFPHHTHTHTQWNHFTRTMAMRKRDKTKSNGFLSKKCSNNKDITEGLWIHFTPRFAIECPSDPEGGESIWVRSGSHLPKHNNQRLLFMARISPPLNALFRNCKSTLKIQTRWTSWNELEVRNSERTVVFT